MKKLSWVRAGWILGVCAAAAGLTGALAQAGVDFSGHWRGPGEMTDTRGNKTPCSSIELKIVHHADSMEVTVYDARCGFLNSNWGPYSMTIDGGKVFEDGEEIGNITDNVMKTLTHSGGVQYAFNLRRNEIAGGAATLDTYYGVKNLVGAIVIEGTLTPVQ